MPEEKFACILRLQSLEKICGYIGTSVELKSIFSTLEEYNKKGHDGAHSRKFQFETDNQKVYCLYKKRYWRGFVMTKMTDAEYLVRLPDLGLIVQVKKWRLSNAFFNGPERELIKFFRLRKWCTLFKDNSLQQYKTMTIEYLKNLLYVHIPCSVKSFSPKENFHYIDLLMCRKSDNVVVNIAEMILQEKRCLSFKETEEMFSFTHIKQSDSGVRNLDPPLITELKNSKPESMDKNNNWDVNMPNLEPVKNYLFSEFEFVRAYSNDVTREMLLLFEHICENYDLTLTQVVALLLVQFVKFEARARLNVLVKTGMFVSEEILDACFLALKSKDLSQDNYSFLKGNVSCVLDHKQLANLTEWIDSVNSASEKRIPVKSQVSPKSSRSSHFSGRSNSPQHERRYLTGECFLHVFLFSSASTIMETKSFC